MIKLKDARNVTIGSAGARRVMLNGIQVWPSGPLDFSGHLKYYHLNITQSFLGEPAVNGLYSRALSYKGIGFGLNFLPPDTARNPFVYGGESLDENIDFRNTNFSLNFFNIPTLGEFDFELNYNRSNITQSFLGEAVQTDGLYNQLLSYKGTGFGLNFLPPDTARNPFVYEESLDENIDFRNTNFSLNFFNIPTLGEFDFELKYNRSNITQSFLGEAVQTDGLYDQLLSYKGTGFGLNFLPPDTARNPFVYEESFDENINFRNTNFSLNFFNIPTLGEFDFELKYDRNNITQSFLSEVIQTDGLYDQFLSYKGTGFGLNFLPPDTARNPFVYEESLDEHIDFRNTNFSLNFFNIPTLGEFDFELKYDRNNITQSFLSEVIQTDGLYDQFLSYKGTGFGLNFLPPDTARNPFVYDDYVEYIDFRNTNFILNFSNPLDLGVFDNKLIYTIANISNSFK